MKYLVLLIAGGVSLNACTVLTKSQIKNINAFATSAKSYSSFPSEIIKKRSELVLQERLVGASQLPNADQIKVSIENAQKNYQFQQQLSDSLDLSLRLIQQYATLLTKLSSPVYVENLTKNTTELNENLGDLVKTANTKLPNKIPTGVGDAISKAIFLVGENLTKSKQARALKEFIPQGDTLIAITAKNLTDALSINLKDLLASDKQRFINTYTNTVLVKPERVDYFSLSHFSSSLNNYDNVEQLRVKCIEAANKLAIAHSRLKVSIQTKHNLTEIFHETQDFIVSVQGLFKIVSQFTSTSQS